jgi:hypothetical protein
MAVASRRAILSLVIGKGVAIVVTSVLFVVCCILGDCTRASKMTPESAVHTTKL